MRNIIIFFVIFLVVLFILALFFPYNRENKYIFIEKGSSISKISNVLKNEDVIFSEIFFKFFSIVANKPLKAGYYYIEKNESIFSIWLKLYKNKESLIKVVIVPGDNLFSIAQKLEKKHILDKEEFIRTSFDKYYLISIGFPYDSIEGFVIPDTYFFPKGLSGKFLVNYFINVSKDFYKAKFNKDINDREFYKKLIIASLIEKETANDEEKYIISGIIHNRLNKNMPLQIDATLIYIALLKGIVYNSLKDIKPVKSKFNTYLNKGLPPTPICSISTSSLKAALFPRKTKYLFYFTEDGKKHIFSNTYKEHLKKLNHK